MGGFPEESTLFFSDVKQDCKLNLVHIFNLPTIPQDL